MQNTLPGPVLIRQLASPTQKSVNSITNNFINIKEDHQSMTNREINISNSNSTPSLINQV